MANELIRLLTDEDVHGALARALRVRGFDALSCPEVGRADLRLGDDLQLEYATREGRVLVAHNVRDYAPMHRRWQSEGRQHAGILLIKQGVNNLGELLQRIEWHAQAYTRAEHYNQMLWLIQTESEVDARLAVRQAMTSLQQPVSPQHSRSE